MLTGFLTSATRGSTEQCFFFFFKVGQCASSPFKRGIILLAISNLMLFFWAPDRVSNQQKVESLGLKTQPFESFILYSAALNWQCELPNSKKQSSELCCVTHQAL